MSTLGVELEWPDVDRRITIPPHLGKWDFDDYSIVNSTGIANDPTGITHPFGGEINTAPTATPEEQGEIVRQLAALLHPSMNHKSNTHIHVAPHADLLNDLPMLKSVAQYLRAQEAFVYSVIEPLPKPGDSGFTTEEHRGAIKRWRRNLKSHQHSLSAERFAEMMSATSVQGFKDAHASPTSTGKRAWHIASRPGMNLRSLWKNGTIEFRHFHGSYVPSEIVGAARWCQTLVDEAVSTQRSAAELYQIGAPWIFPHPCRYDHDLALGFERTKWKK